MTNPQNNKFKIDDHLADFTDQILNENQTLEDETPFASDPKLRALEQTALRLKNSFPKEGPSEEVIRRMHKNIVTQWQQQSSRQSEPFWKKWMHPEQKWLSQHARRSLVMASSAAVLILFFAISIPLLSGSNLNQPAATGQNPGAALLVATGGIILLAIWFFRRKR